MNTTRLPKVISAEDLLSTPIPPTKWIIPGLLPAGLALFAGPSKAGKSWLTLWLCLQVAQGKPVWGREIESRTVLYLSLEDTLNRLQDRLFRLVGSEDTPERLILQTECPGIGQGLEEQITSFLYNHSDTGLVVIDTLQKVRSCDQSGSMYASDYKDVSALKSLADKYGICILLILKIADRHLQKIQLHCFSCHRIVVQELIVADLATVTLINFLVSCAHWPAPFLSLFFSSADRHNLNAALAGSGFLGCLQRNGFFQIAIQHIVQCFNHGTAVQLVCFQHLLCADTDAVAHPLAHLGHLLADLIRGPLKYLVKVLCGQRILVVTFHTQLAQYIQQYVMAEAERIEKKFKYGVEESDQTHFEQYAENWLKRQQPFFKATTYAGYKRNLDIVYPLIGGIPLAKLLPMTLEEMCEELRKRPGRGGNCIKETTVQKYLETVSSVLEDAKKNDIIPFNPAHRVRKKHFEKEVQHIPQKYEMGKLMRAIQNEPILYRAYYTLAITTGLRRGELCALQWRDITGACELTVRRSRSCASGQIVESDTKSHRERIVTIPMGIWELLMALRQQQMLHSGVPDREQPIFTDPDGHVPHPDSFTRHLRKLYKKCGLSENYHLHTLRHFYATYLLQEGTSKQVAASLLGHADTAFLERTYCHPQDVAKQQAANLMQDLLNNQNPCYVAFMKNKNRKAKKAG